MPNAHLREARCLLCGDRCATSSDRTALLNAVGAHLFDRHRAEAGTNVMQEGHHFALVSVQDNSTGDLTPLEHDIIAFAQQWFFTQGRPPGRIQDTFGLAPVEFWRRTWALVDDPRALNAYPMVIRRLRRVREGDGVSRTMHPSVR